MRTYIQFKAVRILFSIVIAVSVFNVSTAQTQFRTVTGVVYSGLDSIPQSDVFVYPLGRTQGVTTDFSGEFSIMMSQTDTTLVLNKPGYVTVELYNSPEAGEESISVYIFPETEYAPTGYKEVLRSDLSGAQSQVKAEKIENVSVTSFDAALQGRVAGLHALSTSGVPGAAQLLRIRGINSPIGGTEPLIVIDGVPVITGNQGDGGGMIGESYGFQNNPLADIELNDIESIEVLKDAGALGIYGARAANGVVLVKTKRGKSGRTNFNLGYYTGVSQPTNRVETISGSEYLNLLDRAYENTTNLTGASAVSRDQYTNPTGIPGFNRAIAESNNTDWMNSMLRTGSVNQINLSAQGGTQKVNFYVSGNYRKEKGVLSGNDFERASLRFNADNQATDKLKIGIGNSIALGTSYYIPTGNFGSGFGAAQLGALPIYPQFYPAGSTDNPYPFNPYFNAYSGNNSLLTTDRRYTNYEKRNLRNIGTLYGEYAISSKLKYRANFGFDYMSYTDRRFDSRYTNLYDLLLIESPLIGVFDTTTVTEPAARALDRRNQFFSLTFNNFVNYDFKIKENHEFSTMLGYELTQTIIKYNASVGIGLPNDDKTVVSLGALPGVEINGAESGYRYYSYFTSTNYKYKNKYYATLTVRTDASTRFGTDVNYVWSPTLSLAWRVTEDYLTNISVLNDLKLRTSFGRVGNSMYMNNIANGYWKTGDRYLSQSILGVHPYSINSSGLTSEKSDRFDLGADAVLLNNRIFATIDYYNNTGRNIVLPVVSVPSAGVVAPSYFSNEGKIRNTGVELSVKSANIKKESFQWTTELIMTHNRSKVLSTGAVDEMFYPTTGDFILAKGSAIGNFYLPQYAGRDEQGREMIFDKNGNAFVPTTQEEVDNARVVIKDKSIMPKVFGGFANDVKFKSFDLSVFFTYSLGNHILDAGERAQSYVTGTNTVRKDIYEELMSDAGDKPKVFYENAPGTNYFNPMSQNNSTRFLHNASYVRLKNVTLGYTLPVKYSSKIFMNSVRVYVAAQNLLTFTSFKGWDPEAASNLASPMERAVGFASTSFDLPQVRTYTMGINFNF